MTSKRWLVLLFVIAVLPLASCSGLNNGGCSTNCGGTNATLSISMYDTPPTGVTLLSFTLPIAGLSLTPASGSPVAITPAVSSVEATRLQTDSVLLADAVKVTTGSYSAVAVTLGPTSATTNVFINTSGSTITYTGGSCVNNAVCYLPAGAIFTISVPMTLTLSSGQNQWIGLNLNLNNAITTANGISVDFSQSSVLTATTTTRAGLPSGAVETIEDFVGTVTALSSSSISVLNGVSGQTFTAALNSSTEYDNTYPSGNSYTGCGSSSGQGCLKVGSTVSVDANLSSAGLLTATEVDVLDATAVDEVEGIIYPTNTTNVFGLLIADKVSISGNAVLSAASTTYGTPILLSVGSAQNFAIDTKTLSTSFTPTTGFASIADLLAGQQVRVQLSNVTTSTISGTTVITATANNMMLRFSRMSGTPSNVGSTSFNFAPPTYVTALNSGLGTTPLAYTFTTTLFDGVTDTAAIANNPTVAIRALFLDNASPTFAVAKARVP
jgi:Domain of unknown function (DUF5666)